MLLKFQHILSNYESSKGSTKKCQFTIFKKNLMKWMNKTSKQKSRVIALKKKLFLIAMVIMYIITLINIFSSLNEFYGNFFIKNIKSLSMYIYSFFNIKLTN